MNVANKTCSCVTVIRPAGTQTRVTEHTRTFALPGAKKGYSSNAQARVPKGECFSVAPRLGALLVSCDHCHCDWMRVLEVNVRHVFEVLTLAINSGWGGFSEVNVSAFISLVNSPASYSGGCGLQIWALRQVVWFAEALQVVSSSGYFTIASFHILLLRLLHSRSRVIPCSASVCSLIIAAPNTL